MNTRCFQVVVPGPLVLAGMFVVGCQQGDAAVVDPIFDLSASAVMLQTGDDGLQFSATSENVAVEMNKVDIADPVGSPVVTFTFDGAAFDLGEPFDLQSADTAYPKAEGTWSFDFAGTRPSDGAAFAVTATFVVAP